MGARRGDLVNTPADAADGRPPAAPMPRHSSRVYAGRWCSRTKHLDTLLPGEATIVTGVKLGATHLVPLAVANISLLPGSHRPWTDRDGGETQA